MGYWASALEVLKKEVLIFQTVLIALGIIIGINLFLRHIKIRMLKKAKTKQQITNIKIFFRLTNIVTFIIVGSFTFFFYSGSWTGLGVFAGLLTAALGFALQKPITGMAAWLIIVTKKPFQVGDRIMLGNVRGEVYDITLTHTYLDEIGGDTTGEDYSGRNVAVPNHMLFDHNIINYTLLDDLVLGEIAVNITYESDLDKAIQLSQEAAKKYTHEYNQQKRTDVKVRAQMDPSNMTLKIRFFAPVKNMPKIRSDITIEIYNQIKKEPTVDIAYPHTQLVVKKGEEENPLSKEAEKGNKKQ